MSRADLGHTILMSVKVHPDLRAYLDKKAAEEYCTAAEYIRRLVIADMRKGESR